MLVVNIVDRLDMVNYGIWNAAIATASVLRNKYGVHSQLWYPSVYKEIPKYLAEFVEAKPIGELSEVPVLPADSIVVSHGCWRFPTRLGALLKKKGYRWMYVPHGMLEPWSMSQKWYLKYPYYWLYEKPQSLQADVVRAVSLPEKLNLQKTYPQVVHIPNGNIPPGNITTKDWESSPLTFLFLGRLHKKKGLIPLIQAWKSSSLNNNSLYQLLIAGPDDGLLLQMHAELNGTYNARYIGAVFGDEKDQLLRRAHFFMLPSYSEGFPTSVVEAMQYGLIPMISKGCNFPEAFDNQLAFHIEPDRQQIIGMLEKVKALPDKNRLSILCKEFASKNFSIEQIADVQYNCYQKLLSSPDKQ